MEKYIEVLGKLYKSYLLFNLKYIKDEYLKDTRKDRVGNPKNNIYSDKRHSVVVNNFEQLKSLSAFLAQNKTTPSEEKIDVKNYFSYANILNVYENTEIKKKDLVKSESELTFAEFEKLLPDNPDKKSHFVLNAKLGNAINKDINVAHWEEGKDFIWEILFNDTQLYGYIYEDDQNAVCIFWEFIQSNTETTEVAESSDPDPAQKIFYGAPGTGKSHLVQKLVKDKDERVERITFHPEYDYSLFVGGYKPTMREDIVRYEFVPQSFTKIYCNAWNDLDNDYYLVIEEINRGNCAEIFGDIFQLLDRNSEYEISPSKELKEFLLNKDNGLRDPEFGLKGGKLKLPNNLNIFATMNTSDQSLFPMDSAFKRRWDWEYVPINYEQYLDEEDKENDSFRYQVEISETETFSWIEFIEKVNAIIKLNENLGMDKCLGNYFVKPKTDYINLETFINKVIFYLWNDVFKDENEEYNIFLNNTSYEDFFPVKTKAANKVKEILAKLDIQPS